ncbi:hypothetical protein [Mycobacterium sp. C31M]
MQALTPMQPYATEEVRCTDTRDRRRVKRTLLALALGAFGIGTGEFGSNGIIELLSSDLNESVSVTT